MTNSFIRVFLPKAVDGFDSFSSSSVGNNQLTALVYDGLVRNERDARKRLVKVFLAQNHSSKRSSPPAVIRVGIKTNRIPAWAKHLGAEILQEQLVSLS